MRTLDKKARREIVFLLGLFVALACAIGAGVWMRNRNASDNPWQISANSFQYPIIALSPDGLFLAGICPTPPPKNALGISRPPSVIGDGTPAPQTRDLVVWRVSDRSEVTRKTLSNNGSDKLQWTSNGQMLAVGEGLNALFLWNEKALTPFQSKLSSDVVGNTFGYGVVSQRDFDADIFLVAQSDGEVKGFQISTGNALPITWRWQKNETASSGAGWDIVLQPRAPGQPLRAVVVESDYRLHLLSEKSKPKSAPRKPAPAPKLTPAQRAFLEKEKKLNQEVEDVVNELMSQEETISDEDKNRLTARANELNAQIKAERGSLFPPKPAPAPPSGTYSKSSETPTKMRITLCDISANRQLWRKELFAQFDEESVSWSPDGKLLAVSRVESLTMDRGTKQWLPFGIAVLDGATGEEISRARKDSDSTFTGDNVLFWAGDTTLVAKDNRRYFEKMPTVGGVQSWASKNWRTLRFIDAYTGATMQHLQLPTAADFKIERAMSTDAIGATWAVASEQHGWLVFSKAELETAIASMDSPFQKN